MFGYRSDGKKVKGMQIIDKAEPFFMPQRIDAVNYTTVKVKCDTIDEFIARERKNGVSYSYMHIVIATLVRLLYIRKKLNRFIMRGSIYQRNTISISMDIKKKLEDDGEQVTLKMYFTGRESLEEVKKIIDDEIAKNLDEKEVHQTTKAAAKFTKLPDFLFRWAMAFVRFLDKHGALPKSLIKASPFHTSCFFTNLKSIKLNYIFHHLYNFGTTTIFVSMGKEQIEPYVENNKELTLAKILTFGMSLDERVADGLYMGKSLRLFKDFISNPDNLKTALPDDGTIPKKATKIVKFKKTKKKTKVKKEKKSKTKKIKPLHNKEKAEAKKLAAKLNKEKKQQKKLKEKELKLAEKEQRLAEKEQKKEERLKKQKEKHKNEA